MSGAAIQMPVARVPLNWLDPAPGALKPMFPVGPPLDFGGAIIPNPDHIQVLPDTQSPGDAVTAATLSTDNFHGNAQYKPVSTPAIPPLPKGYALDPAPATSPSTPPLPKGYRLDRAEELHPGSMAHGGKDTTWGDIASGAVKAFGSDIASMIKVAPGMFETPGVNPGTGELTTGAAGRSQENVAAMAAADAERKARGETPSYRARATAAQAVGVNVPEMEKAAREGDVGGVLGHAAAPAVVAAAPLAAEGLGRVARMPAMEDLVQAKTQAIRDAGTKAVRVTARATNKALEHAPGAVGGAAGAYLGHATGLPEGGLIGAIAVRQIAKDLVPAPQLPASLEHFGLPDRVTGGPATIQEPISLSQLNGAKPQITPKITPKAVETQISDALGGKPLQKNVPLRAQVPAAAKTAAAAQLPEGFTPALKADGTPSSALRGYKYDPATREFESISKDGSHYIHGDVSPEEVQAFENAESKGKAWNQLMDQNVRVAKVVNGKRMANPKAQPSGTPTEEAPGGVIQNTGDLTSTLNDSLKNIQNLPKDPAGKPIRYVYRARDVGEEGVPLTNKHASATSDAKQAIRYAEAGQRAANQGQVVRIDLSKLSPEDYIVQKHPDGMSWVQFTRPLTESEVSHYAGAGKNASK